ncbi:ATP-binding protein [Sphaerisporangium aureirubrum]|uniref:ATP-binding protein n=1 Tax=Sphaerisporangium aureirubrum TaxID=1544736 RepID=A0ABW1NFF1_9ACTN
MRDHTTLPPPGTDVRQGNLLGVVDLLAVPESASEARRFVREKLGGEHPALDDVTLLVSELVTNSLRHSDSRGGGSVTVAIADAFDRIHIDVVDAGSRSGSLPRVCAGERTEELPEGGRGLWLVENRSLAWGVYDDEAGRTVWCQVGYRRLGEAVDSGDLGEGAGRQAGLTGARSRVVSSGVRRV